MDEVRTRNLKPLLDNANLFKVLETNYLEQNLNHDFFKSTITRKARPFERYKEWKRMDQSVSVLIAIKTSFLHAQ